MARKRIERRGRPRKASSRSRSTTREGRRAPADHGSTYLLARKIKATGRTDLEVTPGGVLFGYGHLDRAQYDALGTVTRWLQQLAHNLGPKGVGVDHLWSAITGAMVGTAGVVIPISVGPGVDRARQVLDRMLRRLDGSRDLVIAIAEDRVPPLVRHAIERRLTPADEAELERLRDALDDIAEGWR